MFLLIETWRKLYLQEIHISIHLMFLLIIRTPNTRRQCIYFNTSHVSINPIEGGIGSIPIAISIHLMFLLIGYVPQYHRKAHKISIHLMFLLISGRACGTGNKYLISIHLMFLLIQNAEGIQGNHRIISIHLMFLLIHPAGFLRLLSFLFQYISCFY